MKRWSHGFVCVLLMAVLSPLAQAACNTNLLLTKPDNRYIENSDGTVTDTVTGLMWKQCAEGVSSITKACDTGVPATFTWQGALQKAVDMNSGSAGGNQGYTDWRLPNIKELNSLLEMACYSPAINTTFFPATPSSEFWSSSPYTLDPDDPMLAYLGDRSSNRAWFVFFGDGSSSQGLKDATYYLRLVRAGQ